MKLLFLVFLFVLGCDRPNPTPEELDPIYKTLQTDLSDSIKDVGEKEKKLEEARARLKEIVPQSGQTRKFYSELFKAENELFLARQKVELLTARVSSRKFEARNDYVRAFKAKESWPDPAEYQKFQNERTAKAAPKDWRQRKPSNLDTQKSSSQNEPPPSGH